MIARSVVVTSIVPDRLNHNWRLREYVAEGFAGILGTEAVSCTASDRAVAETMAKRPDLVVAFGGVMPDATDLTSLRSACTSVGAHLALWLHDDPYELDYAYRAEPIADTIFTNDSGSADYYRHPSVHHLPLAASPTAHAAPDPATFAWDLIFCGVAFQNRIRFWAELADKLYDFRVLVLGTGWPDDLWMARNERVDAGELTKLYGSAAATINLGRDLDLGNERYRLAQATPGPRTFEAAMAGCPQMFFVSSLEITDYFEPGQEIILIDHADDVPLRLRELLDDRERLLAMRAATRARALRDHTYRSRAEKLLAVCANA